MNDLRRLEINGGRVEEGATTVLTLPPTPTGYADAQLDDYGGKTASRDQFRWRRGTVLSLEARFSHEPDQLKGTAGFGFWNAPVGDPSIKRPSLPQAVWFFFASSPNDLPFFPIDSKSGWVTATLDAKQWRALRWSPLTPFVLLGNRFAPFRRRVWPRVRRDLGIAAVEVGGALTAWRSYRMAWREAGCRFWVDGAIVLDSPASPAGPLGFVCWVDNQFMVVGEDGRFRWGTLATTCTQSLEFRNLLIENVSMK